MSAPTPLFSRQPSLKIFGAQARRHLYIFSAKARLPMPNTLYFSGAQARRHNIFFMCAAQAHRPLYFFAGVFFQISVRPSPTCINFSGAQARRPRYFFRRAQYFFRRASAPTHFFFRRLRADAELIKSVGYTSMVDFGTVHKQAS